MSEVNATNDQPTTILVVEDSRTQAEQLRHILEQGGYSVLVAADGSRALQALERSPVDLVITDITMPVMDGYELCRHIKQDERLRPVPVMLLTALSDPVDVIRGLECGADSFTVKPYERKPLLARISYMLANRNMHDIEPARMGIEINFNGQRYFINSDRLQILNLLLSSYEAAIEKSQALLRAQEELQRWNEQLERKVEQRTAALRAEIAERERAEQTLRFNEFNLRLALAAVDVMLFRQDSELRYTWTHHSKPDLAPRRLVGRTDAEVIPATDTASVIELKRRTLESGQASRGQVAISIGKRKHFYDMVVEPLTDEAGAIVGLTGASLDITEQVEAETALHETNALFEGILGAAADGVLIKQSDGAILMANPAAERIFAYSAGGLAGLNIDTLIAPGYRNDNAEARMRTLTGEKPSELGAMGDLEGVRKDGTQFPMEIALSPLTVAGKAYVVCIVRDVSERRLLEQQLRQSQKMEAIGQLTGGVAHDFNNLLGVILGNLDLLEHALSGNDEAVQRVATAQRAAERGADLTKRLLGFSRRQQLSPEPVMLNECVQNLVGIATRTLGPNIKITTHLAPDLPRVLVDGSGLENVLLNLAINSRDAMPHGGMLTLSTKLAELDADYPAVLVGELPPARYACVCVSDSGKGMPPEILEKACEPFFTTKPRDQGTGLGLATVYGFVKQSKGHMNLYSEVGHGTTVRIYLPLAESDAIRPASAAPRPTTQAAKGATVLVVDDEVDLLEVAVAYLEELGCRVLHASDAASALAICEREPNIGLLVTDIMMPGGMSGIQLAGEVRARRPGVRVLYSTGFSSKALAQRTGMEIRGPILNKPYRRNEFIAVVSQVMAGTSTASSED